MITKEQVDRINELARKQRDGGLTGEERTEQRKLREIYLANIRSQVVDAIESSGLRPQKKHDGACGCEHCAPSGDRFKPTKH